MDHKAHRSRNATVVQFAAHVPVQGHKGLRFHIRMEKDQTVAAVAPGHWLRQALRLAKGSAPYTEGCFNNPLPTRGIMHAVQRRGIRVRGIARIRDARFKPQQAKRKAVTPLGLHGKTVQEITVTAQTARAFRQRSHCC